MKRNMLAMLIFIVSLANFVMTAIMVFVLIPSAKSYTTLVNKVAQAIELDIEEENEGTISIEDKEQFDFTEASLTINLKKESPSSADSYVVISKVSLTLNKSDKNYDLTKGLLGKSEIKLYDIITTLYESHTKKEVTSEKEIIKNEILQELSKEFETDAIIDISFGSITCQ